MLKLNFFGKKNAVYYYLAVTMVLSLSNSSCDRVSDPTAPLNELRLEATLKFNTIAKIRPQAVGQIITIGGHELLDSNSVCGSHTPHSTPAYSEIVVNSNANGVIVSKIGLKDFVAVTDRDCPVRQNLTPADIEELNIQFTIPADQNNCTDYCAANAGNLSQFACYTDCINGERLVVANSNISGDDFKNLTQVNLQEGLLIVAVNSFFNSLSPRISATSGPDLRVDGVSAANSISFVKQNFPADSCALQEACVSGPGLRSLLKFNGVIQNLGDQDFVLGNPEGNPLFEVAACHHHHHLKAAMRYELINPNTNQVVIVGSSNIIGRKQGFCMLDMVKSAGNKSPKYTCANQGLTSGWADVYGAGLDCQWVDVTGVPAGNYKLRITVNPDGTLFEADKTNNSVDVPVAVPAGM